MKMDGARAQDHAIALVRAYYNALNRHDVAAALELLAEDVVHELNQGPREVGKAAFAAFLERIEACYHERLDEVVVLASADGSRASAEYMVDGRYVADDIGMPPARGQCFRMPGAAFFALRGGRIRRVSDHYNLQEWFSQVAAQDR